MCKRIAASEARTVKVGVNDFGSFKEKLYAAASPRNRYFNFTFIRRLPHIREPPRRVAREPVLDGCVIAHRVYLLDRDAADAPVALSRDVRSGGQRYGVRAVCYVAERESPSACDGLGVIAESRSNRARGADGKE